MKRKLIISFLFLALTIGCSLGIANSATTTAPQKTATTQQVVSYVSATPLEVVKAPQKYLNKNIVMKATFDKFTNLGLDYKPAMRSSQKYITFLVLRDDVGENTIPLSEMKLFLTRKTAEKFIDLETGDKIQIEGKVFSNALSDAWIDVSKITVLKKKNPKKASVK